MSIDSTAVKHREFEFSDENFERVVKIIYKVSGISLSERKQDMVYSRLARRLRKLGLRSFDDYLNFVKQDSEEQKAFVNALTTNLTHFFREEHHFDYIIKSLLPEVFSSGNSRIRIWSAGCSTGEEPYTLGMVWEKLMNKPKSVDFKILATDLDTNVLETAQQGIYSMDKLAPIAEQYLTFFDQTAKCSTTQKEISDSVKKHVHFKQLNLMQDWPMKGPFQLIMCRNVLIYFDKPTQAKLIKRFHDLLEPRGHLILGHSESLGELRDRFENIGKTIFRKVN